MKFSAFAETRIICENSPDIWEIRPDRFRTIIVMPLSLTLQILSLTFVRRR